MTKIYVIRHAESEGNAYRRAHGQFDGRIVDMGFDQIDALRKRFEGVDIDCIYSSDLVRTCTTATALSEPRNLEINKTKALREVCMGIWEDNAWGDIEHSDPDAIDLFNSDPSKWKVEGSESYEQVQSRMLNFLLDVGEKHIGGTIAVVTHGFAIKALLCKLLGYGSHEASKVLYCDNTAVSLLNYDNGQLSIEYQGDNSHLSNEISTFFKQAWWTVSEVKVKENLRYELVDSATQLSCLGESVMQSVSEQDFDAVFLSFLDMEPVGVLGITSKSEEVGEMSYFYVKSEHSDRNFIDQFIGQAMSFFRKCGKNVLQVSVQASDDVLNTLFQRYAFSKISENNGLNSYEKSIY